jgi:hypothetical protein
VCREAAPQSPLPPPRSPWLPSCPIRDEYLIVDKGRLAGTGAHSYSAGNATGGSEEAAKFKKGA